MVTIKNFGQIFNGRERVQFADLGTLVPTPICLDDRYVRVFYGGRDTSGVSRISFFDVDAKTLKVESFSEWPVIEPGFTGLFDSHGVLPARILGSKFFYVGFRKGHDWKFEAYTGVLEHTGLENFKRVSSVPLFDRAHDAVYINALHDIWQTGVTYEALIVKGMGWQPIEGRMYPRYETFLSTLTSELVEKSTIKLDFEAGLSADTYRTGRPQKFYLDGDHFYVVNYGTTSGVYEPAVFDEQFRRIGLEFPASQAGFDDLSRAYPSFIQCGGRNLVFYNGNDMGKNGIGVGEVQ